jgi:5'-nucleotidase
VPGPVTVEQMFNIFPFDNSITKMQLSGVEVQDLFDFAARRSSGRGCVSQVQIAGARVVIDCTLRESEDVPPGVATNIYIGTYDPPVPCPGGDADCPGGGAGSCDAEGNTCWRPLDAFSMYELATSNYLAAGGSGFRVLQRNTTQFDTQVQQRDALIDFIRAGSPCGSDYLGELVSCSTDAECIPEANPDVPADPQKPRPALPGDYVCACPEAVEEGLTCAQKSDASCDGKGTCVLRQCRADVAAYQREICERSTSPAVQQECQTALAPCATGGEQCKFLACVDRKVGNFSDGRLKMVGQ